VMCVCLCMTRSLGHTAAPRQLQERCGEDRLTLPGLTVQITANELQAEGAATVGAGLGVHPHVLRLQWGVKHVGPHAFTVPITLEHLGGKEPAGGAAGWAQSPFLELLLQAQCGGTPKAGTGRTQHSQQWLRPSPSSSGHPTAPNTSPPLHTSFGYHRTSLTDTCLLPRAVHSRKKHSFLKTLRTTFWQIKLYRVYTVN
jgi:hypothetical protein